MASMRRESTTSTLVANDEAEAHALGATQARFARGDRRPGSPSPTRKGKERENLESKRSTSTPTLGEDEDPEKGLPTPEEGTGTIDDPYVLRFAPGDKDDPYNWSTSRKSLITCLIAIMTLSVSYSSSAYTGGFTGITERFDASTELVIAGVSLYVLGFAVGPLLWAPLSELLGRRPTMIISLFPYVCFFIGCALAQNITTILVCRFFGGFFGASALVLPGGIIGDLFHAHSRGLAMSSFSLMAFAGPCLGPITGAFVGKTVGWRWLFWIMLIFAAVPYVLCVLFIPETFAPIILRKRAKKLTSETTAFVSHYDLGSDKDSSGLRKLWINLIRPFQMLFQELICLLFAIYLALIYGILYLLFEAIPIVFEEHRRWESGVSSLPFVSVGLGMLLGVIINSFDNTRYSAKLAKKGGHLPPEERLPLCCVGGCVLVPALFWFAWTSQPEVHWLAPMFALAFFGAGMVLVFMSTMNYLIDAYLLYAASALAANSVLRSLFGSAFPLFAEQMYTKLGPQWASTLLAFLALLCAPIPFAFYKWGPVIRRNSKYAPHKKVPETLDEAIEEVERKQEEDPKSPEAREFRDMQRPQVE